MKKKVIILIVTISLILMGCSSTNAPHINDGLTKEEYDEQMNIARTTPYGKYPELITYSLGKMTGANNSNMPEGDTYEDNAYTRYIKEKLNVQNKNVFEANSTQYDTNVSMAITSQNLPDIMVVSNLEDLQLLVSLGLVEDLTESFEQCMSERIKDIYNSYDDILDVVTFNGKIMAIPETNITDGPNLVWLRKDWMDKLGLKEPQTLSDVENIVREFIEKDPGNNGANQTVGIVCDTSICGECGYSSEYLLDLIFANYNAFPKQWIRNSEDEIVYGSIQPECKAALEHINSLYCEGIIDRKFLVRTTNNIIELIENGKCGSFFGPWWAANNPLISAVENDKSADWRPYLISTDKDGNTSYVSQNPSYKYVVVRKGYEYPEIACKIISTMFDDIRYNNADSEEFIRYFKLNVDPTARPIAINVDYNNALSLCYSEISEAIEGTLKEDELLLLEKSYYQACRMYLYDRDNAAPDEWAAYVSRILACSLLDSNKIKVVKSVYFGTTDTMSDEWWKLKKKENEVYLKIITGEENTDYFDEFVKEWKKQGGDKITEEVVKTVNK